jgi:hypothetical protein
MSPRRSVRKHEVERITLERNESVMHSGTCFLHRVCRKMISVSSDGNGIIPLAGANHTRKRRVIAPDGPGLRPMLDMDACHLNGHTAMRRA